jgi:hypothetical protein
MRQYYEYMPVDRLKFLENNPRTLNKRQFSTLKESIKAFPRMLEKRPIIASNELIVYGGNMRLRAAKAVGLKEVPVIVCHDWTHDELERFKLVDNISAGSWDYDLLANDYDANLLNDLGLDVWTGIDDVVNKPVKKKYIKISIDPTNLPKFTELLDTAKDATGIYDDYELITKALTNLTNG